jgi:hypothetical protein
MKNVSINKVGLTIGGILFVVLVLFAHFVPVLPIDTKSIYDQPKEKMADGPVYRALGFSDRSVKLSNRNVNAQRTLNR